jgi:beta-phosphoglucomutase
MTRALQGVVFDMDGVLVDSHAIHREAWRRFLSTVGHEVPEHELDFILDGRKRSDILLHFLGDRSPTEIEEFGRRKDCIFRQMQAKVAPLPGVVRLLYELQSQGVALGLATSASRSRATSTLARLGIENMFRAIVTGDDVESGKPDPAIYQRSFQELGINPACLLAVEDAIAGVQAAASAGLHCIAVASHENSKRLRAAGAVHIIQNFENVSANDLQKILLRADAVDHQALDCQAMDHRLIDHRTAR